MSYSKHPFNNRPTPNWKVFLVYYVEHGVIDVNAHLNMFLGLSGEHEQTYCYNSRLSMMEAAR